MSSKPKILVLPAPLLYNRLFSPEDTAVLQAIGEVTLNPEERNWSSAELAQKIPGYDIVITGWGSPIFTEEVMAAANRLRLIAHSAGSIKRMLPPPVFDRVAVTHSAVAIAPAVADLTILLILLCLRQVHKLDRWLKAGTPWQEARARVLGQELAGTRVGVVGAGYTGRKVIGMLVALEAEVWVYDPYLADDVADEMGVRKARLDDLFANCPVVTMQAPPTEETYRMVGARQLSLLQDGAIFINTARSHTVDQEALLAELRSGRIQGALDVFDGEPLPPDSPFLQLDNVITTPHVAGHSRQAQRRQGRTVVEEIQSFLEDETLRYEVKKSMLATMA
jgi:phosphoglycerate dehydrogenase-like enzyme